MNGPLLAMHPEITSGMSGGPTQVDILLIEDDRGARDTLQILLRDVGYRVAAAHHGRDAIERLREGLRPTVILLDLMMPVMDGWEFRSLQMADPELREIPVIVTTALPPDRTSALEGVTILRKPIDLDRLLQVIQETNG